MDGSLYFDWCPFLSDTDLCGVLEVGSDFGPDVRIFEAGTGTGTWMPSQTSGCIIVKSDNVASTWPAKRTGNGRERAAVKT